MAAGLGKWMNERHPERDSHRKRQRWTQQARNHDTCHQHEEDFAPHQLAHVPIVASLSASGPTSNSNLRFDILIAWNAEESADVQSWPLLLGRPLPEEPGHELVETAALLPL